MATRDEVKSIMYIIANEYDKFIPSNKGMTDIKINTWFSTFKKYDYEQLQQATMEMLKKFEYGTPKIAHLSAILEPKQEKANLGSEYAQELVKLSRTHSDKKERVIIEDGKPIIEKCKTISIVGDIVLEKYGQVGYDCYINLKDDLRVLEEDEVSTFKAQVRTVFNSIYERNKIELNQAELDYQKTKMIK